MRISRETTDQCQCVDDCERLGSAMGLENSPGGNTRTFVDDVSLPAVFQDGCQPQCGKYQHQRKAYARCDVDLVGGGIGIDEVRYHTWWGFLDRKAQDLGQYLRGQVECHGVDERCEDCRAEKGEDKTDYIYLAVFGYT